MARNFFCGSPDHALDRRGFLGTMAAGAATFAADMTGLNVLAQPGLVFLISTSGNLFVIATGGFHGSLRPDEIVLPAADLAQQRRWFELGRANELQVAHDQLHRRCLVVRVVDGEARIDADSAAVAAEYTGTQRVERAHRAYAVQCSSKAVTNPNATVGASRPSIWWRGQKCTSSPSRTR